MNFFICMSKIYVIKDNVFYTTLLPCVIII